LSDYSAPQFDSLRGEAIKKFGPLRAIYLAEYEEFAGTQSFVNSRQNYPLLVGGQANTYKCFIERAWAAASRQGVQGFLHPEGVYEDPRGGALRSTLYRRLRYHFQFQNETGLFPDVHHETLFSVNICGTPGSPCFDHIANLFDLPTIDRCYDHDGQGTVSGIKDANNEWNTAGHKHRILAVDETTLSLFASLYDSPGSLALAARLPSLHAHELVSILPKFVAYSSRLADIRGHYKSSEMWHETNSTKSGTIQRNTRFPESPRDLILTGAQIGLANPYFKTPRRACKQNSDYDPIDLAQLPDDYLPRTNYNSACDLQTYRERTTTVPWRESARVTDYYRLISRKMLDEVGERTLMTSIIPPEVGHIHGCFSLAFLNAGDCVDAAGTLASLPVDFLVKTTRKSNCTGDVLQRCPWVRRSVSIRARILLLNCLTQYYAALWRECWDENYRNERWAKVDSRLIGDHFRLLQPDWSRSTALRTDYQRRQALVEIDVLVAMELRLTADDLCNVYRIQFPTLRQNEADTWFDQTGRIVFTSSRALPGVGFTRKEWENLREMRSGTVSREIEDDTLPGGPRKRVITYEAPFDRCDREEDYRTAWAEFETRRVAKGAEA